MIINVVARNKEAMECLFILKDVVVMLIGFMVLFKFYRVETRCLYNRLCKSISNEFCFCDLDFAFLNGMIIGT